MNKENTAFEYNYSAKEQAEIKKIREKYAAPEEAEADKMELLRRLDAGVTKKGTTVSLVIGIIGTLLMGCGMSLIMTDIGKILGSSDYTAIIVGVVVGVIGMALVAFAYPLYNRITKKERQRIAPEILRLTDELMK